MTKARVLYRQGNGRCRWAESHSETHYPGFLLNHREKQAHTLNDDPTFYLGEVRRFSSWQEFLEADPPPPDPFPEKLYTVCEEGNPWPVSFQIMPDMDDRQMQYAEVVNQSEQKAYAGAARETYQASLRRAWSMAALMVFCIVSALIVLIALQSKLGQGIIDSVAPSVAVPALLGMVMTQRAPTSTAKSQPPQPGRVRRLWPFGRRSRFDNWERVIEWDHAGGEIVWAAELPLPVIYEHLSPDCRDSFESAPTRRWVGAIAGIVTLLVSGLGLWLSPVPLFWVFAGAPTLGALAVLWGYQRGYKRWMPPSVWFVRRLEVEVDVEKVNTETGEIIREKERRLDIQGIPHTHGTGIPPEMAAEFRRQKAARAYQIEAARRRQARNGAQNNGDEPHPAAMPINIRLAQWYEASYASSLAWYEILMGRDFKKKLSTKRKDGDKLEKVSQVGMALGSVGLLIVAVLLLE